MSNVRFFTKMKIDEQQNTRWEERKVKILKLKINRQKKEKK